MFTALERLPEAEMAARHEKCRQILSEIAPEAGGLLVFSRLAIYYLTGTWANGVLWLPVTDQPVLLCRKGSERAALETPLPGIFPFRSYSDIPGLCAGAGSPLSPVIAAEQSGLPWNLANLLTSRLPDVTFVPGDTALIRAQAEKSAWELAKIRLCGARHAKGLRETIPARIRPGMTEREISHQCWQAFFELGAHGAAAHGQSRRGNLPGPRGGRGFRQLPERVQRPGGAAGASIRPCPSAATPARSGSRDRYLPWISALPWRDTRPTRRRSISPAPPEAMPESVRRGHDFCIRVQQAVAAALRPGAIPSELYALALAMADKEGLAEGFMGLGGNKVQFLGHGIGLTIDGWPVLAKGFDAPLAAGMTLALEPKFGIPDVGMVGVENTFEVTPQGGVCLTGDAYDILCID